MSDGEMVSVKTVARLLGVDPQTVRRLIWRGELAATRVGRAVRVSKAALAQYLKDNRARVSMLRDARTERVEGS